MERRLIRPSPDVFVDVGERPQGGHEALARDFAHRREHGIVGDVCGAVESTIFARAAA
jgi:hypothetical protein